MEGFVIDTVYERRETLLTSDQSQARGLVERKTAKAYPPYPWQPRFSSFVEFCDAFYELPKGIALNVATFFRFPRSTVQYLEKRNLDDMKRQYDDTAEIRCWTERVGVKGNFYEFSAHAALVRGDGKIVRAATQPERLSGCQMHGIDINDLLAYRVPHSNGTHMKLVGDDNSGHYRYK